MPRYIDATPAQRWHLYQKPADRRLLAEAPDMEIAFAAEINRLWDQRRASETPFKAKACARCIRNQITYLRNYRRSVKEARARLEARP